MNTDKTLPNPQAPPITASLDKVILKLKKEFPEFHPSYIRFPINAEKPMVFNGKVDGQPFYYSRYYNSAVIDPQTGMIKEIKLITLQDKSVQLSSIAKGIHFDEFGSLPIKILFSLAGLSAPLLSITGFLLWKWKKQK